MRHSQQSGRSRSREGQGFASTSPSVRRHTASEGGRAHREYRDSLRDEDYDNYRDYDDIEDEGYERGGYSRSSGRGGEGRRYNLSDRNYRDYDEDYRDFDEGYRDENVRGRRGFDAMDPEERHEIFSRNERAGRRRTNRY